MRSITCWLRGAAADTSRRAQFHRRLKMGHVYFHCSSANAVLVDRRGAAVGDLGRSEGLRSLRCALADHDARRRGLAHLGLACQRRPRRRALCCSLCIRAWQTALRSQSCSPPHFSSPASRILDRNQDELSQAYRARLRSLSAGALLYARPRSQMEMPSITLRRKEQPFARPS